jgi:hypothetical protein
MTKVCDLQKEINKVKSQLAQIEEPDNDSSSDEDKQEEKEEQTETEEVKEEVKEETKNDPVIDEPEEDDEEEKPKKKSKKKSKRTKKKVVYESSSDEESSEDDSYTIEFVINRIHDQLKFFQKIVYRMISKYKGEVFDKEEVEELNEMFEEEQETFHNSYDEALNILPFGADLHEKIYNKFEKELDKIQKKWNTFLTKLEVVK